MIDVHCHILPLVDDGSKDWDMSIEMCRIAKQDGITHIVATPHANYRYAYDRARHQETLEELKQRVPSLDFVLGCDFHLSEENIQEARKHPSHYTIGNTRYILVEFSDFTTPQQMMNLLLGLQTDGFITVITHPERNPIILQYPELIDRFADSGAILQITAGSLTGNWGRRAKHLCEMILKKKFVAVIASDAHETKHRTPVLSIAQKAASKLVGSVIAEQLVRSNPWTIITNGDF
jgi:protein-tyrosine phosphatase